MKKLQRPIVNAWRDARSATQMEQPPLESLAVPRARGVGEEELPAAAMQPADTEASPVPDFDDLRDRLLEDRGYEAIVRLKGRPVLLVRDGDFDLPDSAKWRGLLGGARARIRQMLPSIGRVDLVDAGIAWAGTAWMIRHDIAVTNRHVAKVFARTRSGVLEFRRNAEGREVSAFVDFGHEWATPAEGAPRARVAEVLYIAPPGQADVAFLRLEAIRGELPPPLEPKSGSGAPDIGTDIAVIGYPARDSRNDAAEMERIFEGVYDVKRLAPGSVMHTFPDGMLLHDASTLGGCSGSPIVDLATGGVVGLHFKGRYLEANAAVPIRTVLDMLRQTEAPASIETDDTDEAVVDLETLSGRGGYNPRFLGIDVPLPGVDDDLLVPLTTPADDRPPWELQYTHYSVAMHRERKLAAFTAVNIDGERAIPVKRGRDRWATDPRIPRDAQLANELYKYNPLDRGHLVRRLDPAWGNRDEAEAAALDTFFYTNCAPQHEDLNQKTWLGLEEYLLDNVSTHGFKASVFTGPVFREDDPEYRDLTKVPQGYWKVAVMLREGGDRRIAVGYFVGQAHLLDDLEFVFGNHGEFQIPIARIEELTGMDFGTLKDDDPLGQEAAHAAFPLHRPDDLVLG